MKKLNPAKEAKRILKDLLGEYDRFELSAMSEQEAVDTVSCYSFEPSEVEPIAQELFNLTQLIN